MAGLDLEKLKAKLSPEDQQELDAAYAALESQRKARAKEKERMSDPELKAKAKDKELRRVLRAKLMIQKAVQAGITVTDEEVTAEIRKKEKVK